MLDILLSLLNSLVSPADAGYTEDWEETYCLYCGQKTELENGAIVLKHSVDCPICQARELLSELESLEVFKGEMSHEFLNQMIQSEIELIRLRRAILSKSQTR